MSKRNPNDARVLAAWEALLAKVQAAWDQSGWKGSIHGAGAYERLCEIIIPEEFEWEVIVSADLSFRAIMLRYIPAVHEVINEQNFTALQEELKRLDAELLSEIGSEQEDITETTEGKKGWN